MYNIIKNCRICKADISSYELILDLGVQALTGVFPRPGENIEKAPITVIRCPHCGLVQLLETVEPTKMFGDTYGYASALNNSMVRHLEAVASYCKSILDLKSGDIVVDIGSNDATYLKNFKDAGLYLLGMDPTAIKYLKNYHENGIQPYTNFFSSAAYNRICDGKKAKLITTLACFYDTNDPVGFAKEVSDILDDSGKWVIEAAYLPAIIENTCFDGCCHEHLSYYSLLDIRNIADQSGLFIQDVEFNDTNGGSFRVTLGKDKPEEQKDYSIGDILDREQFNFEEDGYFSNFTKRVVQFKQEFISLLTELKSQDRMIYGLGASTKFNVILQYCNIDTSLMYSILDVNDYKFYRTTPGTRIPIYSEIETLPLLKKDSVLVVGPWHFKQGLLKRQNIIKFRESVGKLVFPLPKLEII